MELRRASLSSFGGLIHVLSYSLGSIWLEMATECLANNQPVVSLRASLGNETN